MPYKTMQILFSPFQHSIHQTSTHALEEREKEREKEGEYKARKIERKIIKSKEETIAKGKKRMEEKRTEKEI